MSAAPLEILELEAENIKRIVAVRIRPDGKVVEITGKNAQGKTSVLDSILWAIAGARHIQSQPIRKGQNSGRIRLDLGEVIVKRTFTKNEETGDTETKLTVEQVNGAKFNHPQTLLASFMDALTFDPLAFARAEPKEQFNQLRRFVPDVDFEQIERENKRDFDDRTAANRRAREAKDAAAQIVGRPDTPNDPLDEAALVGELERAGKHNTELERRRFVKDGAERDHAGKLATAQRNRDKAAKLRAEADEVEQTAVRVEAE